MNNILDLLYKSSEDYSGNVALEDEHESLTYSELLNLTQKVATAITKNTQNALRQPIVVFIDRNIESVVSFYSIVHSGNYYVPIDTEQPKTRIDMIIEDLQPIMVINATKKDTPLDNVKVHNFEDLLSMDIDYINLNKIRRSLIDSDPLYAMFTSGSTGRPKGVLISHRSILDLINQFTEEFLFTEQDIFGNQAPFDFDVSSKDIYNSLAVGARVSIIPRRVFSFPKNLIDYLNDRKINIGIWATSVLRIIENFDGLKASQPTYLEKIMFSGEVMPNKVLNYWRNHLPDIEYINLYGPTEITCNCTFYRVDRTFKDDEPLPIGIPFKNTRILLLNDDQEEVVDGKIGEICVVGNSLALGYINNEEETLKSFIQNPLNSKYPERIYRTGDLGLYAKDGNLMFISRKDFQIKHMGHRIELNEIEVLLSSLPYLRANVCLYDEKREKIVLFYESDEESRKKIYKDAQKMMPKYMIPNKMIHLEKFPLNNNQKIDRNLLRKEYIND